MKISGALRFKGGIIITSNVFQIVKANVTARQAAEMYGLKVDRKGMACCPFHHDKSPSMKLDERYYCFGCGVTGDAVDFTMQLLGLRPKEAAFRLAADFGISILDEKTPARRPVSPQMKPRPDPKKEAEDWINHAMKNLIDYRWLLKEWEETDAPQSMDEEWDQRSLFCEAIQQKSYVDYLLDELMGCNREQIIEMQNSCRREVERIEKRLRCAVPGKEKGACTAADERRGSG